MADNFKFSTEPSPEVLRYFREKKLKPSFNWQEVWTQEHAHSFTVAKSTGFDILADVRDALQSAIQEGKTYAVFQKELEPVLRKKGWWGKRAVVDPQTGETIKAQLGSPRRLRVIYNANMRSARGAGQWERAQRTKGALPYFQYRLGPSEKHRPHHAAMAGTIRPVDDVLWQTWYTPNGWGCKCWLKQLTKRGVERNGGVSDPPKIDTYEYTNKRTGKVEQIPVGIDPGWHSNPGRSRAQGHMGRFFERLEDDGSANTKQVIKQFWQTAMVRSYMSMHERVQMPAGFASIAAKTLNAKSDLVSVSNDTLAAKLAKHGSHADDTSDVLFNLPHWLEAGELINARPGQVWIIAELAKNIWKIVLKKNARGYLHVQSVHPVNRTQLKRAKAKK